ncbi:MAG: hypothetical protein ABI700_06285 [Chloroflexota bacterium]
MNSRRLSKSVLDLAPWPNGLGFKDAKTWWAYVLSQPEKDRIDFLMTTALLSENVAFLLLKHDLDLLERFELTEQTIALLSEIDASTLAEFSLAAILKFAPSE